ncbi:uncharacterized protein LOC142879683 isoform X2 [Nelusetta ayraudi]|uniref:uncharacterized protein LOC142879683 isoform X2 n=1 Tax=Nelusetta ayraudi TaxID=303726 RepID=UPI003F71A2BC
MCGVEWMKASARLLPFLLLLRGSAAAAAVLLENDTISLNCDQLIDDQTKCDATTWVFYRSIKTPVELITLGQITSTRLDVNKVHRLKVLENCSLEIKSVTAEDAGRYHCQQYRSGKKEGQDTVVELAVVTMSEVEIKDEATLTCNVATHKPCTFKVYLMFKGSRDKLTWPRLIPSSLCKISQKFTVYQHEFKKRFTSLWCIVENKNDEHTFLFHPQPSGRNTGTTTQSTTTALDNLPTDPKGNNFVVSSIGTTTQSTTTALDNLPTDLKDWWWLGVIATVLLAAACTLTCATVLWCKRNKARKTHTTDNLSINKNMGAENRQCSDAVQANEEDGVFYTSVNFTGIRKAKVRDKNDESRFEEVTYSTVKASSTDPSHIYASVNPSR